MLLDGMPPIRVKANSQLATLNTSVAYLEVVEHLELSIHVLAVAECSDAINGLRHHLIWEGCHFQLASAPVYAQQWTR